MRRPFRGTGRAARHPAPLRREGALYHSQAAGGLRKLPRMTHTDLILIAAGALFAAFLAGWLAGWLTHRAALPPVPVAPVPVTPPAEPALRRELAEARLEIEELRGYIERRLARPDQPDRD